MILQVSDGPVPIYEQIVARVIFSVAAGDVPAGELLPSVRELAQKLLVHPNTVARAIQELEREGVVTAKRGVGMEVTPAGVERCRERRREIVRGRIRAALQEGVASALPPDELRALVEQELHRANGKAGRRAGGGAA